MLYPLNAKNIAPPVRTIEQALADLADRLDTLPASHPDRALLGRQIAALEDHLCGR